MSARSTEELEALLQTEEHTRLERLLRKLPHDVDPVIAASAAVRCFGGYDNHPSFFFVTSCADLPLPVIREVLPRLPDHPHSVFLKAAFDGTQESWRDANLALRRLQCTYNWGSKPMRAHLKAVASDRRHLAAAQAASVAAVGGERDLPMLAVLAIDGSEASVDALLPHFANAAHTRDAGLEDLQRLKTHASNTPALAAMFIRLEEMVGERERASPALDVPRAFGIETDRFQARVALVSLESDFRTPELQATLVIDSEAAEWFHVAILAMPLHQPALRAEFTHASVEVDELKVGRCDVVALPAFLATCASRLRKEWNWDAIQLTTNLRGRKRGLLMDWLRGLPAHALRSRRSRSP